MNVLVVDDDSNIRNMLDTVLKVSGFNCLHAQDSYEANEIINQTLPDVILVDWMMPYMNGVEWIKTLRKNQNTATIPIMMITAKVQESNIIKGLTAGADDYITKPFSPRELIARIQSLIRRSSNSIDKLQPDNFNFLVFDEASSSVNIQYQSITLGTTEYKLLEILYKSKNRPLTRTQILEQFGKVADISDERTIDVYIKRLRKSLKTIERDNLIETIRGRGYRLNCIIWV